MCVCVHEFYFTDIYLIHFLGIDSLILSYRSLNSIRYEVSFSLFLSVVRSFRRQIPIFYCTRVYLSKIVSYSCCVFFCSGAGCCT